MTTTNTNYAFYWVSGSSYSWSVMFSLEYKGLAYQSHRLNGSPSDLRSQEYLAINPRGKVPTLKGPDFSLYESIAIMAFLERQHPDIPIFGATPLEAGMIWQRLMEIANYGYEQAHKLVILPLYRNEVDVETSDFQAEFERCRQFLQLTESWLKKSEFLAGRTLSAADIYLMPLVCSLQRAAQLSGRNDLDVSQETREFPNLQRWLHSIQSTSAFIASFPPHWVPHP